LAGAVLVELASRGRISLADGTVTVVDATPVGDPVLDRGLASLVAGGAGLRTQEWINWLREGLRDATLVHLVQAGVLRREPHKVLWVVPDERFPPV
jgi:hypothetical protein